MKIVIDGAGEVGAHLARMLRAEANEITVIDNDEKRLADLAADSDLETLLGDPSSIQTLKEAGVGRADLFIAVYPYSAQEINLIAALLAKRIGAAKVAARINNEEYLSAENRLLFKELGIELLIYPERIAADEITAFLKHSSTADTMDFARGKLQIAVFKLNEDSPIVDMTLGEFITTVKPSELQEFRILAVSRDGKTIIPTPQTKFHFSDLVFAISRREGIPALYGYFGKDNIAVRSVFILGGSSIAAMLSASLVRQGIKVKLVDKDTRRCIELSETLPDAVQVINGDGKDSDFLFDEGIHQYDAFIALTGKDETNVLSCVVAKKFGVNRTVAEVENIEYIRLAEEMGVDNVINKKLITASRIFKFTLSGRARFVRYMTSTNAEVIEYTVAPGSAITKGPLKSVEFPRNAIIAGVVRGSEAFIAVGDTCIEAYDRVAIFALPETIREIDKVFK